MESMNLAGRVSAECQPLCVAARGVVLHPPPARPAPRTPAPRDRGATPPGQVLHWGGQMAYLLFDSLEGLQRNGPNLGRSGTLHVQPFKDD